MQDLQGKNNIYFFIYIFSRVKLTSEGKIIVKGVKKFDLKERCNVLEIVLAEKITSAKQTEAHLKVIENCLSLISRVFLRC